MRMFAELISSQVDIRNITNRQNGQQEPTEVLVLFVLDQDFPENMTKVTIWKNFNALVPQLQKGCVVELMYRSVRPGNDFDKRDQISVNSENIRFVTTAAEALKKQQAELEEQMQTAKSQVKSQKAAAVRN